MGAASFALQCVMLMMRGQPDEEERAVRAGMLEACQQVRSRFGEQSDSARRVHALVTALRAAAARHDAARCTHADCVRCAGARKRCELCALPGCGLRRREGDDRKALMRCSTCRAAMYCGAAHQKEHWPRHKAECRAAADVDLADQLGAALAGGSTNSGGSATQRDARGPAGRHA